MKHLARFLIVLYLGLHLYECFTSVVGKYSISVSNDFMEINFNTNSIKEDTINKKITFTDINFKQEYTITGNYIITKN